MLKSIIFLSILLCPNITNAQEDTCAMLTKEVDDFDGSVTFRTPFSYGFELSSAKIGTYYQFGLTKSKEKGKIYYYLSIETTSPALSYGGKGVYVLFTDGTKWIKSTQKIDVDPGDNGFVYKAFISITPEDVKVFSKKPVKKFKLYVYDDIVEEKEAIDFMNYSKCMQTAK